MSENALIVETNEDGEVKYAVGKNSGYAFQREEIPYVWPEDEGSSDIRRADSLEELIKQINIYNKYYLWMDGQPLKRVSEGRYAVVNSYSDQKQGSISEGFFDISEDSLEDYRQKEWSLKDKQSPRRVSNSSDDEDSGREKEKGALDRILDKIASVIGN